MFELPLDKEYNLQSLKELLADRNIRYIFLGGQIDKRLLIPNHPLRFINKYKHWFANDKSPYSLEKDLEILHAYIRDQGGLIINKNRHGEIYYLDDEKPLPKQSGLISNGSFEYWWKDLPMGKWELRCGKVSRSAESTEGSSSLCLEPDDKKGSIIAWRFPKSFCKNGPKLRVRLDARASKDGRLVFYFIGYINKKWEIIKPGTVRFPYNDKWVSISQDFVLTPDIEMAVFDLRLLPGAKEPAYVDNLSIERLKEQ